jgi:hypothetical protein
LLCSNDSEDKNVESEFFSGTEIVEPGVEVGEYGDSFSDRWSEKVIEEDECMKENCMDIGTVGIE